MYPTLIIEGSDLPSSVVLDGLLSLFILIRQQSRTTGEAGAAAQEFPLPLALLNKFSEVSSLTLYTEACNFPFRRSI